MAEYTGSDQRIAYLFEHGGGGGGGVVVNTKWDLLWENSQPTTATSGFTVTINNLADYDYLGVIFMTSTINPDPSSMLIIPNKADSYSMAFATSSFSYPIARVLEINGTNLIFGNGIRPGVEFNSTYAIPYQVYGIKDAETGHAYSTDEKVVGTWIDGKPIYEKSYFVSSPVKGSTQIIQDADIANVKYLVKSRGSFERTTGSYVLFDSLDSYESSTFHSFLRLVKASPSSNEIGVAYNITLSDGTISNLFITIQYTKTTD